MRRGSPSVIQPKNVVAEASTITRSESGQARKKSVAPKPSQTLAYPAREARFNVPRPQIVRIQMRHAGESNREIARAEGRDRETVARIVKSSEMAGFVEEMKEEFRGLVPDAINAIRYALQVQKDARIALEILRSNGLAPRPGEPEQLPTTPATKEERDARQIGVLAAVIAARRRVFGIELPDDMAAAIEEDEAAHSDEAENRD